MFSSSETTVGEWDLKVKKRARHRERAENKVENEIEGD